MCQYTYTHTHTHIHTYMYIHIQIHLYTHIHTYREEGLITLSLIVVPKCEAFSLAEVAHELALLVKLLQPEEKESQALASVSDSRF